MKARAYPIFLGVSALLHILFLFMAFAFLTVRKPIIIPPSTMTLVLKPTPPIPPKFSVPQTKQQRPQPFIDSGEMVKTDQADPEALFQSNANTRAMSKTPKDGDTRIGGQSGAKDIPLTLRDSTYSPQNLSQAGAPTKSADTPNPSVAALAPARSTPVPTSPPVPTTRSVTPVDATLLRMDEGLPVATPTPTTSARPEQDAKPAPQAAPAAGHTQGNVPPSMFSAEKHLSEVKGGAIQGDDISMASQETELGRYKSKLYRAIGSRWYLYVQRQISLLSVGNVRLRFYVRANGVIEKIEVIKGDARSPLAAISRRSVTDVGAMEPFSEQLRQQLGEGYSEEITFSIY